MHSRLAALVLFPLLLTACRSGLAERPVPGPQALVPPVIEEQFTPLPCPRRRVARGTTVGLEGCAEKKILRTDSAINMRARAIFRLLHDPTAKRKFVAAERAWLVYRRASCTSAADVYRGGTAEPVAFADCVVTRDREHLVELAPFEAFLRSIR